MKPASRVAFIAEASMKKSIFLFLVAGFDIAFAGQVVALEPFVAKYQVFNGGKRLGEATMQVVRDGETHWRIDLDMRSTRGLTRLAGANAHQSTVFDIVGDAYRPLSQSTARKAAFTGKRATAVYDWNRGVANWSGDVKPERAGPVKLQGGDLDALLINLAVVRDLKAGKPLKYRMVEDGRVKQLDYAVAGKEQIDAGGKLQQATKLISSQDNDKQTIAWIVDGMPVPARILQRDKGVDASDLRLIQIR
jgi:hypothetical protein